MNPNRNTHITWKNIRKCSIPLPESEQEKDDLLKWQGQKRSILLKNISCADGTSRLKCFCQSEEKCTMIIFVDESESVVCVCVCACLLVGVCAVLYLLLYVCSRYLWCVYQCLLMAVCLVKLFLAKLCKIPCFLANWTDEFRSIQELLIFLSISSNFPCQYEIFLNQLTEKNVQRKLYNIEMISINIKFTLCVSAPSRKCWRKWIKVPFFSY